MEKTIANINKTISWFFEKINNLTLHLKQLEKEEQKQKKTRKSQDQILSNIYKIITTNPAKNVTELKRELLQIHSTEQHDSDTNPRQKHNKKGKLETNTPDEY